MLMRGLQQARTYQFTSKSNKRVKGVSYEEIQSLWDYVDSVEFADMVIIGIYTGFRPQELAVLEIHKIKYR